MTKKKQLLQKREDDNMQRNSTLYDDTAVLYIGTKQPALN